MGNRGNEQKLERGYQPSKPVPTDVLPHQDCACPVPTNVFSPSRPLMPSAHGCTPPPHQDCACPVPTNVLFLLSKTAHAQCSPMYFPHQDCTCPVPTNVFPPHQDFTCPVPTDVLSHQDCACPNSITNWGPRAQIHEPLGDISCQTTTTYSVGDFPMAVIKYHNQDVLCKEMIIWANCSSGESIVVGSRSSRQEGESSQLDHKHKAERTNWKWCDLPW